AVDRLLAAVGVAPPVLSEFEGMSTIVSLVARGIGIAILPRMAVVAAERRVAVRDLPHGQRAPSHGSGHRDRAARRREGDEPVTKLAGVNLDLDAAALTARLVDIP